MFTVDGTAIGTLYKAMQIPIGPYLFTSFLLYIYSSASMDYTSIVTDFTILELDESERLCVNITLISDLLLEDVENFQIFLSTNDPAASITQPSAVVNIFDSQSKCLKQR